MEVFPSKQRLATLVKKYTRNAKIFTPNSFQVILSKNMVEGAGGGATTTLEVKLRAVHDSRTHLTWQLTCVVSHSLKLTSKGECLNL